MTRRSAPRELPEPAHSRRTQFAAQIAEIEKLRRVLLARLRAAVKEA